MDWLREYVYNDSEWENLCRVMRGICETTQTNCNIPKPDLKTIRAALADHKAGRSQSCQEFIDELSNLTEGDHKTNVKGQTKGPKPILPPPSPK